MWPVTSPGLAFLEGTISAFGLAHGLRVPSQCSGSFSVRIAVFGLAPGVSEVLMLPYGMRTGLFQETLLLSVL